MGNASESSDFVVILASLLDRKGISSKSAARMADMSPAYGAGVIGGGRAPARDDVLRLALAVAADAASANGLLGAAGLTGLDPKDPRDEIIIDALSSGSSLRRANVVLLGAGKQPLS